MMKYNRKVYLFGADALPWLSLQLPLTFREVMTSDPSENTQDVWGRRSVSEWGTAKIGTLPGCFCCNCILFIQI